MTALVVNEDPRFIEKLAASLNGCDCVLRGCSQVKTALRAIKINQPDIIILGPQLPIADGIKLYNEIRNDKAYKWLPFIFISNYSAIPDYVKNSGIHCIEETYDNFTYLPEMLNNHQRAIEFTRQILDTNKSVERLLEVSA